jgi:diguanylate cyclase (GGDEF)-like protein
MNLVHSQSRGSRYLKAVVVLAYQDAAFQKWAAGVMEELGYETYSFDDPAEVIKFVQFDFELSPIILIAEFRLQSKTLGYNNGLELIGHWKALKRISPIVSYLVCDRYDDNVMAQGVEVGAQACFSKEMLSFGNADYFRKSIFASRELLRLQHAEVLDSLTSDPSRDIYVYNEAGAFLFFERIWRLAKQSKGNRQPFTPGMISLDLIGFGGANIETHEDGNRLLRDFTYVGVTNLRPNDRFARLHGDECCILLPDTNTQEAGIVARRLNSTVRSTQFYLTSGTPFVVAYRYGVAVASRMDLDRSAKEMWQKLKMESNTDEREKKALQDGKPSS